MTLSDADLDLILHRHAHRRTSMLDVPALVAEVRRLRAALQQIARVEPGLAALPGVAKRVLDGEE